MLTSQSKNLTEFSKSPFDWPWGTPKPQYNMYSHELSGSGGYAEYIYKYVAKHHFNMDVAEIEFKPLRNPDFKEVVLKSGDDVLLKFAIANGFRNIQNLVQKMKRKKCDYHFVEVMACPSGCLNGGAQNRPQEGVTNRDLITRLEDLYRMLPKSTPDNSDVDSIYNNFLDGSHSDKTVALLHTEYHAVEKMNTALNIKW